MKKVICTTWVDSNPPGKEVVVSDYLAGKMKQAGTLKKDLGAVEEDSNDDPADIPSDDSPLDEPLETKALPKTTVKKSSVKKTTTTKKAEAKRFQESDHEE